jgi:hypothetical protein
MMAPCNSTTMVDHGAGTDDAAQALRRARGRELFVGKQYPQTLVWNGTKPPGGTSFLGTTSSPLGGEVAWECSEHHLLELSALAFSSANKGRRHCVELFLRHGSLLQAVRFILNIADVLYAASTASNDASEDYFVEGGMADEPPSPQTSPGSHQIQVPSLLEAAAAVGMVAAVGNRASLSLGERRELNMRMIAMARALINAQGDRIHRQSLAAPFKRRQRV